MEDGRRLRLQGCVSTVKTVTQQLMLQSLLLLRMMHITTIIEIPPGVLLLPKAMDFILGEQVVQGDLPRESCILDITSHLEELITERRGIHMSTHIVCITEEQLCKPTSITILAGEGIIGLQGCRVSPDGKTAYILMIEIIRELLTGIAIDTNTRKLSNLVHRIFHR